MAKFKLVVSDPKSKRAFQMEVDEAKSNALYGKKIKDEFSGDLIGLPGYTLQITGGSDKDGFPMRADIPGILRKKLVLAGGVGFHPKIRGQRKRRAVRGNTISESTSQINLKAVKYGAKDLKELIGVSEKSEEDAKKPEEKEEKTEKREPEVKEKAKEAEDEKNKK